MKTRIGTLVLFAGLWCAASGFAQTATGTVANKSTAATSMTATQATQAAVKAKGGAASAKVAGGGGAGKVWVNKGSKTYHCEGSRFYGKTKDGEYMAEAAAKTQGYQGVKGKACAK